MRIVVINHLTLDGVMQAPGQPDEDTRDGFAHGGWAAPVMGAPDPTVAEAMDARMARSDGLLLGRRTYEDLLASWNAQGGPFKDVLNQADKYVASTRRTDPLPWPNSTMLGPDVLTDVIALRARPGRELHVLGSGQLVGTMLRDDLVDELLLIVHPVVLGSGRRLFADGVGPMTWELGKATPTPSGAIVVTYRSPGPTPNTGVGH